ncbi:hypothetical protein NMY22_g13998 [Coprinellus aureogranulatus]|nr:hypothetical protein NMY22_g13998 [Coprinellus aureogranulatus]
MPISIAYFPLCIGSRDETDLTHLLGRGTAICALLVNLGESKAIVSRSLARPRPLSTPPAHRNPPNCTNTPSKPWQDPEGRDDTVPLESGGAFKLMAKRQTPNDGWRQRDQSSRMGSQEASGRRRARRSRKRKCADPSASLLDQPSPGFFSTSGSQRTHFRCIQIRQSERGPALPASIIGQVRWRRLKSKHFSLCPVGGDVERIKTKALTSSAEHPRPLPLDALGAPPKTNPTKKGDDPRGIVSAAPHLCYQVSISRTEFDAGYAHIRASHCPRGFLGVRKAIGCGGWREARVKKVWGVALSPGYYGVEWVNPCAWISAGWKVDREEVEVGGAHAVHDDGDVEGGVWKGQSKALEQIEYPTTTTQLPIVSMQPQAVPERAHSAIDHHHDTTSHALPLPLTPDRRVSNRHTPFLPSNVVLEGVTIRRYDLDTQMEASCFQLFLQLNDDTFTFDLTPHKSRTCRCLCLRDNGNWNGARMWAQPTRSTTCGKAFKRGIEPTHKPHDPFSKPQSNAHGHRLQYTLDVPSKPLRLGVQSVERKIYRLRKLPSEAHPFTIASIPENLDGTLSNEKEVVFLVRTRGGFTRHLRTWAESGSTTIAAYIDGPYGVTRSLGLVAAHENFFQILDSCKLRRFGKS